MSTFTINTCTSEKYSELLDNNSIKDDQLYIVDNDDNNRMSVPSIDYLNTKLNDINGLLNIDNATIGDIFKCLSDIKQAFSTSD